METFDVVVVGAGSGGLTTAVGLAKIGRSVLLIERDHLGGECTNSGCIPSKALLHHARSYAAAVGISGSTAASETFRRAAFPYVRDIITETLATETPDHFEKMGITVVLGEAIFTGKRTLTVGDTAYGFTHAVVATGSSPRFIKIPGLADRDILTNQNMFTLDDVPKRTLVIGGGPIGMEMGQAFALLGSQVTIIDTGASLGKLEDSAVAAVIQETFRELGITFIGNATVTHVTDKIATVAITDSPQTIPVPFDAVLMAIGRIPNLPTGLEAAEITYSEFGITVNRNYQTSNPRIYALGDVADRLKFTHMADDVARQVVVRLATRGIMPVKTKAVPKVTYTKPELAQVGLSQREADETYGATNLHRIVVPFNANDRARTDNAPDGMLVVIVRRLSGQIVGAHIAGARAGELIAIFTLAIDHKLSLFKLRTTIYAYPTYALLIKKAGDYFFAVQISTLKADLGRLTTKVAPKILLGLLWLSGLYLLYRYQVNNNLTVTDSAITLFNFISLSVWGPALYIIAYAVRPITFIPGTVLTVLSGAFFGLWGGIIYTIIGANASATLAYVLGRFFGKTRTQNDTSLMGRFAAACQSNPFTTVLSMRLLFLPFDVVNYGAGLLKIPYLPYLAATIIGTLLGIITFVSIGASISVEDFKAYGITTDTIDSTFLLLSAVIFIVSIAIARALKKK